MTGRGDTKSGEGVSLRGVRPALRISPATWLLVLLLERVASPLSLTGSRQQGSRNAYTSTARKLLNGLLRKPYNFRPYARPLRGVDPHCCRMNGGLHISKKRITTIYPRDRKALSALSRCGYVSREQLGQFLRSKRIESYCKDGLIVKSIYSQPGSKAADREVYRLTPKGRDFCRRELSLTRLYSAQNPAHDLVLADRYFSLSENERETWQTESQSRDAVSEHIRQLREQGEEERARELWDKLQDGRLSMPDAVYTRSDGVSVAFEVVTNNYGQAELETKEQAAEALGAEIELQRT